MTTEMAELRGLSKVRVNKGDLLEAVKKNRDDHRKIFEEALDGWRKQVVEALEQAYKEAKEGKNFRMWFDLPRPEDHTKEYDQAITMLEFSMDDELELTQGEFAMYVMDEWGWQRTFAGMAQSYNSTTANAKFGNTE